MKAKYILTSLSILVLMMSIISCGSDKRAALLEGQWKFDRLVTVDNRIFTDRDSAAILVQQVYEFYPNSIYTFEAVDRAKGRGELVIKKGRWALENEKRQSDSEQLFLVLRERQLEGFAITRFKVHNLDESQLVLETERNNRYFFSRGVQNWYDEN